MNTFAMQELPTHYLAPAGTQSVAKVLQLFETESEYFNNRLGNYVITPGE